MPTLSPDLKGKLLASLNEPPFKVDAGETYLLFDSLIVGSKAVRFFYRGKEVFSLSQSELDVQVFGCIPFSLNGV